MPLNTDPVGIRAQVMARRLSVLELGLAAWQVKPLWKETLPASKVGLELGLGSGFIALYLHLHHARLNPAQLLPIRVSVSVSVSVGD